jgi:phospholipid-binding lipoprotein MlaA
MKRHVQPASLFWVAILLILGGCATAPMVTVHTPSDPWEAWNRKVFSFNDGLDNAFLKPVATGYAAVVPQFVRTGVSNFFGNFGDAWSAVNNLLQGKAEPAVQDVMRVTTNSVLGLFGVLDVASECGLPRHNEDFGQTLGVWGVGAGPYLVLPVLGSSTLRDTAALPVDRYFSPTTLANISAGQVAGLTALEVTNTRAKFLSAGELLNDITLDKYTFVRDAHLQRRRSLVFDGDVPETPETSETFGDAPSPASGAASAAPSEPQALLAR